MNKNKKEINTMLINNIKKIKKPSIKIEKTKDYYNFFVGLLKTEDKILHSKEHAWILGINENGYSACCYLVALGSENFVDLPASDLFQVAVHYGCKKIILAHNHCDKHKIIASKEDTFFTNEVYHKAQILGISLYDHIIISLESLESKMPIYYSYKESHLLGVIAEDIYYKPYNEIKKEIEEEKLDYGADRKKEGKKEGIKKGRQDEKILIAKGMKNKEFDIKVISEITGLTEEEIKKLKTK